MVSDREAGLAAHAELDRMRQETDALLDSSARLVEEMQALAERAGELTARSQALLGRISKPLF